MQSGESASSRPTAQVHQPKPSEPIWTLTKGDTRIDARLLVHGEYGVEVQLYADGGFYGDRRFHLRAEAIAYGDVIRGDLEQDGWTVQTFPGTE